MGTAHDVRGNRGFCGATDTYVSTVRGATMSRGVTVPLVTALEAIWLAIQQRHPDVPDVVLTLGAGSLGERAGHLRLGHFAANRWQHGENERLPELFVGGGRLQRRPVEILGTLLHEAAHAAASKTPPGKAASTAPGSSSSARNSASRWRKPTPSDGTAPACPRRPPRTTARKSTSSPPY